MARISRKIKQVISAIEGRIAYAVAPIVAFSGGKDSTLLYALTNEVRPETPVLMMSAFWSKKQKEVAGKVLEQFPPVQQYEFRPDEFALQGHPDSDNQSLLIFYRFGERHLPLIMDVVETDICARQVFKSVYAMPKLNIDYLWDVTLVGIKRTDTHPLFTPNPTSNLNNGNLQLVDPLFEWTDAEVWEAIHYLNLKTNDEFYKKGNELADTGNFTASVGCVLNQ